MAKEVDTEILVEKEQTIQELRDTVEILELKIKKLEQLVRLKDSKIHTLQAKLRQVGGGGSGGGAESKRASEQRAQRKKGRPARGKHAYWIGDDDDSLAGASLW